MGSRKPSAKAKKIAAFKAQLAGADDAFAREAARQTRRAEEHEQALRKKACLSKNRYDTRAEAEKTIRACEAHGTRGLHTYRCPYCDGWHLTSKPERNA